MKKLLFFIILTIMPSIVSAQLGYGTYNWSVKVDSILYSVRFHVGLSGTPSVVGGATVVRNYNFEYSGDLVIPNLIEPSIQIGSNDYISLSFDVTKIAQDAFSNNNGLLSITIPSSVTSIGFDDDNSTYNNPFIGCSSLRSIIVEKGNTIYDSRDSCNAIIETKSNTLIVGCKNTIIPENVQRISLNAFWGCIGMDKLVCCSTNPPRLQKHCGAMNELLWDDVFDESMRNTTLYVNDYCIEKFKEDKIWNQFKEIVPIEKITDFNLTYYVDGEEYKTVPYKYDDEITPEPTPAKEGYAFSGWSEIPERMPGKDVTVTGTFSINKYKLVYKVDGTVYNETEVVYGETITALKAPIKEGYTFSGWSEIPATMPDHDVTITGSFTINTYELKYVVNGNDYKVFKVNYGVPITPEPNLKKKGMTFSGWSSIPETMPAKDVTIIGTFSWSIKTKEKLVYQVLDTINNYAKVIGYEGTSGEIKIAPSVEFDYNYIVTAIANIALYGSKEITKIEIPNSISSIGERAFANIDKLTDVIIYAEKVPETDRTAFENSYIDYVTLHVPYGSIDSYKAIGPWKDFKEIMPIEGTEPVYVETCAIPTISFVDGKLVFESETDGSECHYEIKVEDAKEGVGTEVTLSSTYEIMVYASKEGYNDSKKNIAILHWVNVDLISTGMIDNEMRVNTNAILVQNDDGLIAISGVADDNDVMIYNISGQLIAQGTASGNSIEISTGLTSGDICIIKIGDKSVKYILR